jgi:hypothetical protein
MFDLLLFEPPACSSIAAGLAESPMWQTSEHILGPALVEVKV